MGAIRRLRKCPQRLPYRALQREQIAGFKAIVIEKDEAHDRASLKDVDDSTLPAGDVTVRVDDALEIAEQTEI